MGDSYTIGHQRDAAQQLRVLERIATALEGIRSALTAEQVSEDEDGLPIRFLEHLSTNETFITHFGTRGAELMVELVHRLKSSG